MTKPSSHALTLLAAGALLLAFAHGQAPSPAPAATSPAPGPAAAPARTANILNILEARAATFINGSTLVLAGLSTSVQWVVDDPTTRNTGKIPVKKWFSDEFARNGSWLGSPAAVMHFTLTGSNDTAVVLRLASPVFNETANSVYFGYKPVTQPSQLTLTGGAANSQLKSASISQPQLQVLLRDVALFVDDALPTTSPVMGGTKLGFEPLGGGRRRGGGVSNDAGVQGNDRSGGGLINVGLGGCYYPGGFANTCYGYGYYGGAFGG